MRINFIAQNLEQQEIDIDDTSIIGSLIGGEESVSSSHEDSSYVRVRNAIASPPSSLNTLPETMSVDDLVLVGADGSELDLSPVRARRR